MAVLQTLSPRARLLALPRATVSPGAVVLAAAGPVLFLHIRYQPGVRVPLGSTHLGLELSDVAVLLVGLVALATGLRRGFEPLRPAFPLWVAAAGLLVWILVRSQSLTHAVTAVKFAEYALLAVAAPLLLRRRADWELVFVVACAWSAIATLVGLLQFFGVDIAGAWAAGRRQPSFLGHLDFAALSGLALAVGLSGLVFSGRRLAWIAIASGGIGLVVSGASAGLFGLAAACVGFLYLAWRRGQLRGRDVLVTGGVAAIVAVGVLALRAGDYDQFLRFLGVKRAEQTTTQNVQTYAHHTLLAYIGYRIWLRHPVAGAGWQQSGERAGYEPELPAAHRRFADVPRIAFPAPGHEYGVQNAYVQMLADLGVVGLLLWLATFVAGLVVALRAKAPPAAVAVFVLLFSMGLWGAQGLVAGLPLDALTWLGLGVAATAAANARA